MPADGASPSRKQLRTHNNTLKAHAAGATAGKQSPFAASGRLPQHALLAVTWEDACFELDKDPGTTLMVTVGYLIRQNKDLLVLAGEASPTLDYFRAYTAIPAGMIRSIQPLAATE